AQERRRPLPVALGELLCPGGIEGSRPAVVGDRAAGIELVLSSRLGLRRNARRVFCIEQLAHERVALLLAERVAEAEVVPAGLAPVRGEDARAHREAFADRDYALRVAIGPGHQPFMQADEGDTLVAFVHGQPPNNQAGAAADAIRSAARQGPCRQVRAGRLSGPRVVQGSLMALDRCMESRYEMRQDEHGWTVFVCKDAKTAEVNGVPQHGLVVDDADD